MSDIIVEIEMSRVVGPPSGGPTTHFLIYQTVKSLAPEHDIIGGTKRMGVPHRR